MGLRITMGVCEECGRNMIWGGTRGLLPHTEEFHAQERRRMLGYLYTLLTERLAVQVGHVVVIRFTAESAWTECRCGWRSPVWFDSGRARGSGHVHLFLMGDRLRYAMRVFL